MVLIKLVKQALNIDDGFGPGQAAREIGVAPLQERHLGGQRIGFGGLRSAFSRRQRIEHPGVPLTAPVAQC